MHLVASVCQSIHHYHLMSLCVCNKWAYVDHHTHAVAVSCGYDTWFAVRLVMDYTTSHLTWSILGYLIISNYMPINIGTFHILPTGIHGLCFGSYF